MDSSPGAYGMRLSVPPDLAGALAHLGDAPPSWPRFSLTRRPWRGASTGRFELSDERCVTSMSLDSELEIDRVGRAIALTVPEDQQAPSLVHPWLSVAFALHVLWEGGLPLHAGVVAVDGRAWGVLGTKGAGKTTALAGLWRAGAQVMADDMAAVVRGTVWGGPHYVDLRRSAAEVFPDAIPLGFAGLRSRWRLPTGPAPMEAPLAGWLVLDWGEELCMQSVPPAQRIGLLSSALMLQLTPRDPMALLDAAALPMLRVTRRREFSSLSDVSAAIVDRLSATP